MTGSSSRTANRSHPPTSSSTRGRRSSVPPSGRFDLSSLGRPYKGSASLTLWHVDPPLRFKPVRRNAHSNVRGQGANLIPDGGFETGVSDWAGNAGTKTITRTTTQHASGTAAMSVTTVGSHGPASTQQSDPGDREHALHLSFYAKGAAGESVIPTLEWISITVPTPTYDQLPEIPLNGSWKLITFADTVPSGTKLVRPAIVLAGTPTTTFYVDSTRLVHGGNGKPSACWA